MRKDAELRRAKDLSSSFAQRAKSLTEREREVLDHVARGQSNKVIAQALDISHNTVKLHVRHIMAKLDLGSRVEAAVFAFEHRTSSDASSKHGDLEPPPGRRSS